RRDRVAGVEQVLAGPLGGGDKTPGSRLVAGDAAVLTRRQFRTRYDEVFLERLGRVAVVVPALQRPDIRVDVRLLFLELVLDPLFGDFAVAVVEPVDQAQREEVLAAGGFFGRQPETGDGVFRQPGHRDPVYVVPGEDHFVFERIVARRVAGLAHVRIVELVL